MGEKIKIVRNPPKQHLLALTERYKADVPIRSSS